MKETNDSPSENRTKAGAPPASYQTSPSNKFTVLPEAPVAPRSPEQPESPECPGSPGCLVPPVSVGQRDEKALTTLAARNACQAPDTARKRLWQLARDLSALEKKIERELHIADIIVACGEWYRLSQPFLDQAKTYDVYLAALVAALRKVRVPTGEGETIEKALKAVSKLSLSQLPVIPGYSNAPESWRRVAAVHRELSGLCRGNTYFLSCRDGAKVHPGLSYQAVSDINRVLERLGLIKVIRAGDQRPNGKASEFRYLLHRAGAEEGAGPEI